jgi:copper chaperone CopZ
MKKLFLFYLFTLTFLAAFSQQKFSAVAGQEADFNAKYFLTASIDEVEMKLSFSTDAPVIKAILSVYTPEQLAVRKGTDHTYPFTTPIHKYQFNLNAPAFKGYFAYWLKIYTQDGLFQEYFFKQKKLSAVNNNSSNNNTNGDDNSNSAGGTKIKTNIFCKAGADKTIAALKALDGVVSVSVNIKTGVLTIDYSSDGTPYTGILEEINKLGFNADDSKTKVAKSPCGPVLRKPVAKKISN